MAGGAAVMESYDYTVEQTDGGYAHLRRLD